MPYLIDGNNLLAVLEMHVDAIGRQGLCQLAVRYARGHKVCVVFDGPPPVQHDLAVQIAAGAEVIFAAPLSADDVIIRRINQDSAPRRLHVISTDHVIRKAADSRRCPNMTSDQFAALLISFRDAPRRSSGEPPQKKAGLAPDEADQWLREFQIETTDEDR